MFSSLVHRGEHRLGKQPGADERQPGLPLTSKCPASAPLSTERALQQTERRAQTVARAPEEDRHGGEERSEKRSEERTDSRVHSGHGQLSLSQVKGYRLRPPSFHSTSTMRSSCRARTLLAERGAAGREAELRVRREVRQAGRGNAARPGLRQTLRGRHAIAEVLLCRARRRNTLVHISANAASPGQKLCSQ
ncbi:hypothetical protein EYF80_045297 [Liparis tanakae]|uniref:Uncharacterized protein n=1 Tax=Liparis tanakae TaxID=230148 RepID=A0A4Z2FU26_9TELE|nr:hypothetical protein EYF80_045297 [Liparis tanakae]